MKLVFSLMLLAATAGALQDPSADPIGAYHETHTSVLKSEGDDFHGDSVTNIHGDNKMNMTFKAFVTLLDDIGSVVCNLYTQDNNLGSWWNFESSSTSCINDEASSMVIQNVKAHCIIIISDSPNGCKDYDYSTIYFHMDSVNVMISTFEQEVHTESYDMFHRRVNGLDGKVSFFHILCN